MVWLEMWDNGVSGIESDFRNVVSWVKDVSINVCPSHRLIEYLQSGPNHYTQLKQS